MLVHLLTLAEVLVGGVRIGQGVSSGLKLPDCCVLDVAIHHRATLATFDKALASAASRRHVGVAP